MAWVLLALGIVAAPICVTAEMPGNHTARFLEAEPGQLAQEPVPGFNNVCRESQVRFCANETEEEDVWECLDRKTGEPQMPHNCSALVHEHFVVPRDCEAERKQYCAEVEMGSNEAFGCLRMNWNQPNYTEPCRRALERHYFLVMQRGFEHWVENKTGLPHRTVKVIERVFYNHTPNMTTENVIWYGQAWPMVLLIVMIVACGLGCIAICIVAICYKAIQHAGYKAMGDDPSDPAAAGRIGPATIGSSVS